MAPSQEGIDRLVRKSRQLIAEDEEGADNLQKGAEQPGWRRVVRGRPSDHEGAGQQGMGWKGIKQRGER